MLRPRPSHPDPRAALHQKNFYIIVSIAGAQVETTSAIENTILDGPIETKTILSKKGCMDCEVPPCILVLAMQRSVQESKRFVGFIDTFEEIKSRREKKKRKMCQNVAHIQHCKNP